jgi:hypothetical protein
MNTGAAPAKIRENFNDTEGLGRVLKRTIRLLPSFAFVAVISCAIGRYIFRVPLENLAVVASVPCVVGFVITRALVILMVRVPLRSPRKTSWSSRLFGLVVFFAAFGAVDFLASAGIFFALDLHTSATGSLYIAAIAAILALSSLLLAITRELIAELSDAMLLAAFRLLIYPTNLANFLEYHRWPKHPRWS